MRHRLRQVLVTLALAVGPACSQPHRTASTQEHQAAIAQLPPAWMRGVWTRAWIEVGGVRTSRFSVHYLQTPALFGDVRIPTDRPTFARATSFADLTDDDLRVLTKQRGFTGHVTAVGDTITWHHEIDFQPPDGTADIGRVERVGPTQMYEHAPDSSYVESWQSVASGDSAFLVVRVEQAGRLDRILLVAGDYFLYVRNRVADLPRAASLDSLILATHASRSQVIAYLDCEFSTGRIRSGTVPWEIHESTLPWRAGQRLTFVDSISVSTDSSHVRVRVLSSERWTVPVNTLSRAALASLFAVNGEDR